MTATHFFIGKSSKKVTQPIVFLIFFHHIICNYLTGHHWVWPRLHGMEQWVHILSDWLQTRLPRSFCCYQMQDRWSRSNRSCITRYWSWMVGHQWRYSYNSRGSTWSPFRIDSNEYPIRDIPRGITPCQHYAISRRELWLRSYCWGECICFRGMGRSNCTRLSWLYGKDPHCPWSWSHFWPADLLFRLCRSIEAKYTSRAFPQLTKAEHKPD